MSDVCKMFPSVKNSRGEIVESDLFKQLLNVTGNNRELTKKLYSISRDPRFKSDFGKFIEYTKLKEPSIESLLKLGLVEHFVEKPELIKNIEKDYGFKNNKGETVYRKNTEANKAKLLDAIIEFNNSLEYSNEYVALLDQTTNEKGENVLSIRVEEKNPKNTVEAAKVEYNTRLNERLREILNKFGISVGALTELEERLGINGVTEFERALYAADGIIELIRIAKGVRGENALPEEFSHFIIRAMKEDPMIQRLLNSLSDEHIKELMGDEYATYYAAYEGDRSLLAEEAAGKLLAKHLLQQQEIEDRNPIKNFLYRVIERIKSFFQKLGIDEIQRAKIELNKEFGDLAKQILSGSLDSQINPANIKGKETLYNIQQSQSQINSVLQTIIDNEYKRRELYKYTANESENKQWYEKQNDKIEQLEKYLEEDNALLGIGYYTEDAVGILESLYSRLEDVIQDNTMTEEETCSLLRNCRDYINSYGKLFRLIQDINISVKFSGNSSIAADIESNLQKVIYKITELESMYKNASKESFKNLISPFLTDEELSLGNQKGKKLNMEAVFSDPENPFTVVIDEDLSFWNLWLDSMAESNNFIHRILDRVVKKQVHQSRQDAIEYKNRIATIVEEAKAAGITDFEWLYEKDDQGNKTGNYISEINWGKYEKSRKEAKAAIKAKYNLEDPQERTLYREEYKKWIEDNTEEYIENGKKKRKPKLYTYSGGQQIAVYANLDFKTSGAQYECWKKLMEFKEELDSFLPMHTTHTNNAIKIRKDFWERSKNGIKDRLKESIKDEFEIREDDTEFGGNHLSDFEDREIRKLPIFFLKMSEENLNDLSTDVMSTFTAYANMVAKYHRMFEMINQLENARDYLQDNIKVKDTINGKPKQHKFFTKFEKGEKVFKKLDAFKRKSDSRFEERLNEFYAMQIYNEYIKDEGTFGNSKISKSKVVNFINKITAMNQLGLNPYVATTSVIVGSIMMKVEAASQQFFTKKDVRQADKIYMKALASYVAEVGEPIKTNKLALFQEMFNTINDFEERFRDLKYDQSKLKKILQGNNLMFLQHCGEHWMQNRTALALANTIKLADENGNIVNLWDALEVEYVDSTNPKKGARLVIAKNPDGSTKYKKLDGTYFSEEDVFNLTAKSRSINNNLHGIYNNEDRNVIQGIALGRMAYMYRKWIKPTLNKKFGKAAYNLDLQDETEGYYRTLFRFLKAVKNDWKTMKYKSIATNKEQLNEKEKQNLRRARAELYRFCLLLLLSGLLDLDDDDDEKRKSRKDRSWAVNMAEVLVRRARTEVGSTLPTFSMLREGVKIINSPMAGVDTLEKIFDFVELIIAPWTGFDVLESGRYQGHTVAYKLFMESPLLISSKNIYKTVHPEDLIQFYK